MARYKLIDRNPRLIAINLDAQLLPGTFEYALDYLIDHEVDLSELDVRYRNDEVGASAYPPSVLLKIILFAYSRGIVSSRAIERACREQVTVIALSGDAAPHFTTIASFIATLSDEIARIFSQVLAVCDRQGLIGREMFAIDGIKLPSNASKHRSGTREDFIRQVGKLEVAAQAMLVRHRENDQRPSDASQKARADQQIQKLQKEAAQIQQWLADHPHERRGPSGGIRKSNLTDNESAKMATSHGVIQGYCGIAAVDDRHQIIIEAQAHGTGTEHEIMLPLVDTLKPQLGQHTMLTADAGYHSKDVLQGLEKRKIPALIADPHMRLRDERLAGQDRYRQLDEPLHNKSASSSRTRCFRPDDFKYDPVDQSCVCPAGKSLYQNGSRCKIKGYEAVKFRGAQRDCVPCPLRKECLRNPQTSKTRQVAFFINKAGTDPNTATARMRSRIDSEIGRERYGRRLATVEPVFANLRCNKQLNRFTLRGRRKVDAQWKLYCMVHNIEKLAKHGYGKYWR